MLLNLTENEFFFLQEAFCGLEMQKMRLQRGRGFAPDPTGGGHDGPPDPLWGGNTPPRTSPNSAPSAPRPSRLRRLGLPPTHNFWLRHGHFCVASAVIVC